MRIPVMSAVLLPFLLALSVSMAAQTSTTSVRGTATDKSGAAIAGAKVTLSNPQRGFERSTTTSSTGVYEFVQLTPATYTLTVEATGFRKSVQTNVELLVDTPSTLNTTLQVGAISETIEVSAEGSIVNTTDASIGNAFNERQVKELPLEGRNVPDLLTLQAGVTYTGNRSDIDSNVDTRSGAVNGAHSDQSNVTLDGTDSNDQVNGTAFNSVLPVTLDSVQEFRVTTSNYNADQGRSSGAQVSLVTKSGANAFHGSLYEYHRNTITSANDYFVKTAEVQNGQPNTPLKLIRNIFGASVGGPVIKNRLFFFANYEGYRQREEQSVLRIVPSDSLRDGVMVYQCLDADAAKCPGGPVQGYTSSHNVPNGFFGLTPEQLAGLDPAGVGPNPVMMPYFNTFPHANDPTAGDGQNFVGYRFRGPTPINRNWYIARLDYKLNESGTHSIFWRGALRTDNKKDVPYLLGTPALQTFEDFSKGFTVGYTATLRPTLINNFHWGYTRQSFGDIGNNNTQPFIFFRGLNDDSTSNFSSLAVVRSRVFQAPVQNLVDDITWVKGNHSIQFGTNIRFIRNPRSNYLSSFKDGFTNSSGLDTGGIANAAGSPLDPPSGGYPHVSDLFTIGYNYPVIAMLGLVTQLDAAYNFDTKGNQLPEGAPLSRRFGADEFEFYLQDSYKIKPNLTINYGVRWSLFSPPWETSGTEVAPNVRLGQWFKQRGANMLNGIGSEGDPTVSFDLAGAANHKKGYYSWDTHNFAPRLSIAYSPHSNGWLKRFIGEGDKTVIRAGAGMVYDRIGSGLLSSFDRFGAFGLSTQISNSVVPSADSAPRLTGLNTIPQNDRFGNPIFPPPPVGGLPYTPPPSGTGLGIYWGLDDSIKTPYSYTFDFSIGRELPKNMSLEVSYVGRMSHRLLAQEDLAMPLNLVDKKSGVSYFQAARRVAELYTAGTPTSSVTPDLVGPTAAYWQNMITPLQEGDQYQLFCSGGATSSPLQAVYDIYSCFPTNDTTSLAVLDFYGADFSGNAGILGTSGSYYPFVQGPNTFFNSQFHSLYAWRSIGNASYNAMQVSLRKRMSHGVQFDFNYTYSKAIDLESDAERITPWSGLGGQIINSWNPKQNRAVSDFDTTHQFNLNWIADLPVGHGKALASTAHGILDAVIGGWQLSGLARWTSGFPVNVGNGATWPTNWQLGGSAVKTGPVVAGAFKQPDGSVNLFRDPLGPTGHGAFRNDFPGETGTRNPVRGPGFAGLDMGLSKSWKMPYSESQRIQFRWEVFNVPNLKRFDVQSASTGLDSGDFGKYSGLLTNPRVMQFALRYEF